MNRKIKIIPRAGQFKLQAVCTKCGKVLQESHPMTRKDIQKFWDRIVLDALNITCKDCGTKFPNFSLNLQIVNTKTTRVFLPTDFIKLPKSHRNGYLESIANMGIKAIDEAQSEAQPEVAEEVKDSTEGQPEPVFEGQQEPLSERLKDTIEKRRKYYGQESSDNSNVDGAV